MRKGRRPAKLRVVEAPPPMLGPGVSHPLNQVLSVVLRAGEDVAWTWTCEPGGASYVSGYSITRRRIRRGVVKSGLQDLK